MQSTKPISRTKQARINRNTVLQLLALHRSPRSTLCTTGERCVRYLDASGFCPSTTRKLSMLMCNVRQAIKANRKIRIATNIITYDIRKDHIATNNTTYENTVTLLIDKKPNNKSRVRVEKFRQKLLS